MKKMLPLLILALSSCSQPQPTATADPPPSPAATAATVAASTPRNSVPLTGLPQFGAPDALVTIVEFTDYECPYCKKGEQTMRELGATRLKDTGRVIAALKARYNGQMDFAVAKRLLCQRLN